MTMNLYAIEDGDRIQGDSDDRDLYVLAIDVPMAVAMWQLHYGMGDDEKPYRVWHIKPGQVCRALDWTNTDDIEDVTP